MGVDYILIASLLLCVFVARGTINRSLGLLLPSLVATLIRAGFRLVFKVIIISDTPAAEDEKIHVLQDPITLQEEEAAAPDRALSPEITDEEREMVTETLQAILAEAVINDAEYLAKLHMQLYGVYELFDAHAASTTPTAITQRIVEQCQKLARMALRLFAHNENPQLADT